MIKNQLLCWVFHAFNFFVIYKVFFNLFPIVFHYFSISMGHAGGHFYNKHSLFSSWTLWLNLIRLVHVCVLNKRLHRCMLGYKLWFQMSMSGNPQKGTRKMQTTKAQARPCICPVSIESSLFAQTIINPMRNLLMRRVCSVST